MTISEKNISFKSTWLSQFGLYRLVLNQCLEKCTYIMSLENKLVRLKSFKFLKNLVFQKVPQFYRSPRGFFCFKYIYHPYLLMIAF